jgi:hypothetical protein
MKTASCKQKGRLAQQHIVKRLLETFPNLTGADITSRSMGASGEDILLSEEAFRAFPFAVESKAVEGLNIWSAMKQSEDQRRRGTPLLVFKRNRSKVYCCLEFDNFLNLIKPKEETNV